MTISRSEELLKAFDGTGKKPFLRDSYIHIYTGADKEQPSMSTLQHFDNWLDFVYGNVQKFIDSELVTEHMHVVNPSPFVRELIKEYHTEYPANVRYNSEGVYSRFLSDGILLRVRSHFQRWLGAKQEKDRKIIHEYRIQEVGAAFLEGLSYEQKIDLCKLLQDGAAVNFLRTKSHQWLLGKQGLTEKSAILPDINN